MCTSLRATGLLDLPEALEVESKQRSTKNRNHAEVALGGLFFSKHWTAVLIVSIDVDSDDSLVAL
jgi:hypothetical protein